MAEETTRLDRLLHERGFVPSREKAQALILAGQVLVNGQKIDKSGAQVARDADVRILGGEKYVSRAGAKLEAALTNFGIAVDGRVCLDVGSSTGGFTDCLLQHRAARVYAVDSGTNQMVWSLRNDRRVHLRERTNARYLTRADVAEALDLITVDVSFISVTLLLQALLPLLKPTGEMIVLVKPQFEAGREAVGKGGIVRDPEQRQAAVEKVRAAIEAAGFGRIEVIPSPVLGAEGNQEYLLWASQRVIP